LRSWLPLFAFLAFASTGCRSSRLVGAEANPVYPLATMKMRNSLFFPIFNREFVEDVFFACVDTGENYVCHRTCDGLTDQSAQSPGFICPSGRR
jgi:hypothetical protein